MKKLLLPAVAALCLCSCSTITHTASTESVPTEIRSTNTADLKVSDKTITYKFTPTNEYLRAGDGAVKNAAIAKALEAYGEGDLLVAPEFEIKKKRGLFGSKIQYVVVKGHPASYTNIHPTTLQEAEVIQTLNSVKKRRR